MNVYIGLGEKRFSALVDYHMFTGCDVSGKFAGRTKESTFKNFMDAHKEIYDALEARGKFNPFNTKAIRDDEEDNDENDDG